MKYGSFLWIWWDCLLIIAVAIAASIRWLDYPVAGLLFKISKHGETAGSVFSGRNIIAVELLAVAALAIVHRWNGRLSRRATTILVACSASIMAYTLNSTVLKVIFGRPNPATFFRGSNLAKFNLFRGNEFSSFPSGHMMLASAFLAVVLYAYSRARISVPTLLVFGCGLLVLGDWHFISDVIAGTFLGFTIGWVAAGLWIRPAEAGSPGRLISGATNQD